MDEEHNHRQSKDVEDGLSEKPRVSDAGGPEEPQVEEPWYKARKSSSAKADPFGDEANSEVKYKTMAWW
jgi:hypothetical protein